MLRPRPSTRRRRRRQRRPSSTFFRCRRRRRPDLAEPASEQHRRTSSKELQPAPSSPRERSSSNESAGENNADGGGAAGGGGYSLSLPESMQPPADLFYADSGTPPSERTTFAEPDEEDSRGLVASSSTKRVRSLRRGSTGPITVQGHSRNLSSGGSSQGFSAAILKEAREVIGLGGGGSGSGTASSGGNHNNGAASSSAATSVSGAPATASSAAVTTSNPNVRGTLDPSTAQQLPSDHIAHLPPKDAALAVVASAVISVAERDKAFVESDDEDIVAEGDDLVSPLGARSGGGGGSGGIRGLEGAEGEGGAPTATPMQRPPRESLVSASDLPPEFTTSFGGVSSSENSVEGGNAFFSSTTPATSTFTATRVVEVSDCGYITIREPPLPPPPPPHAAVAAAVTEWVSSAPAPDASTWTTFSDAPAAVAEAQPLPPPAPPEPVYEVIVSDYGYITKVLVPPPPATTAAAQAQSAWTTFASSTTTTIPDADAAFDAAMSAAPATSAAGRRGQGTAAAGGQQQQQRRRWWRRWQQFFLLFLQRVGMRRAVA